MSFHDDLRAGMSEIVAALFVPATLTRTTTVRTAADRDAGNRGTITKQILSGFGLLGEREITLQDGTKRQEATANLTIEPREGDQLTINTRTLEVMTVREINPDGRATAIIYAVTLK